MLGAWFALVKRDLRVGTRSPRTWVRAGAMIVGVKAMMVGVAVILDVTRVTPYRINILWEVALASGVATLVAMVAMAATTPALPAHRRDNRTTSLFGPEVSMPLIGTVTARLAASATMIGIVGSPAIVLGAGSLDLVGLWLLVVAAIAVWSGTKGGRRRSRRFVAQAMVLLVAFLNVASASWAWQESEEHVAAFDSEAPEPDRSAEGVREALVWMAATPGAGLMTLMGWRPVELWSTGGHGFVRYGPGLAAVMGLTLWATRRSRRSYVDALRRQARSSPLRIPPPIM